MTAIEQTALRLLCRRNCAAEFEIAELCREQLPNGCWPAAGPVSAPSYWATALALNTLLVLRLGHRANVLTLQQLVAARPREASKLWQLKFRLADTHVRFDPTKYGWPWVPNSISWIIPTAMVLIALRRGRHLGLIHGREVDERINLGHAMLEDRMCRCGGWNAGNSEVFGVSLQPYIDATALALLALKHQTKEQVICPSLLWLSNASATCRSSYSLAWAVLALRAYRSRAPAALPAAIDRLTRTRATGTSPSNSSTGALTSLALTALDEPSPFEVPS